MVAKRLHFEALETRDLFSITVTGLHHEQIRISNPGNGAVIDLTGGEFPALEDTHFPIGEPLPTWPARGTHPEWESSTAERYPVQTKGTSANIVINGGKIYGLMDERAPWGTWKDYSDGDGLRVEGSVAYEVKNTFIANTFDGIAPRGSVGATFNIHDVFLDRIKDDMVENDDIHSGTIANSYMRGFVFLSARGGSMIADTHATVQIRNTVVELLPEVYSGKLGTGAMFKWADYAGKVDVRDSVFFVPQRSSVSTKIMNFAPGTYQNVTIVWGGTGNYPWPAPNGVTITRDRSAYDKAVQAFFATHPQFTPSPDIILPPVRPAPLMSVSDGLLTEGNAGQTAMQFTVSLSDAWESPISVSFLTFDTGSAKAVIDYSPTAGESTFAPGETRLSIEVPVLGDTELEGNETFGLQIQVLEGATLERSQGIGASFQRAAKRGTRSP